jgi:GntR family transcriptional regulator/MocR family aminotransferase
MRISVEREAADAAPVYQQIADQVRREVELGRLAAGARLPPIRELAERLGVNRDTVALAYARLAAEGVVEAAVGRGTFVRAAAAGAPFRPRFSAAAERALDFERARPRFGRGGDALPLHALIPDPALYPIDAFRRVLGRVLADEGRDLMLYGAPQGHAGLRRVVAQRLGRAGLAVGPDDIVLCHGASQGISLALRAFAEPGDVIALEEPTYNNALGAASALGLRTLPVPMTADGPDPVALERVLERPEVKLFYTIPTFHNPMGTTSSLANRRAVLEIAARHRKPVIEDGYQADLRFEGRDVPALAALDATGTVVQLVSYSKSLFPGLRVGAIAARGRVVDALLALKQATDHSDSIPMQAALAAFLESGDYDRHLARVRRVLRARRDALLAALAEEMPRGARWTTPAGGFQVWVELPGEIDTADLLADAVGAGVLFAPGSQFQHDGRPSPCLRLSFSLADERGLRRGVTALAGLLRERLGSVPRLPAGVHM